jgi:hypothetical protein
MNDKADNKNTLLVVRMKAADKAALKALVKKRDITLSSLVLTCLANKQVPDHYARLQVLSGIDLLTREMNAIGNNINQATIAIHLIKNGNKIPDGEYQQFTNAVTEYQLKEREIKKLLQKIVTDEAGI